MQGGHPTSNKGLFLALPVWVWVRVGYCPRLSGCATDMHLDTKIQKKQHLAFDGFVIFLSSWPLAIRHLFPRAVWGCAVQCQPLVLWWQTCLPWNNQSLSISQSGAWGLIIRSLADSIQLETWEGAEVLSECVDRWLCFHSFDIAPGRPSLFKGVSIEPCWQPRWFQHSARRDGNAAQGQSDSPLIWRCKLFVKATRSGDLSHDERWWRTMG